MIELSLTNEPVQGFFSVCVLFVRRYWEWRKKMKSQVELEPGSRPENQTVTVK